MSQADEQRLYCYVDESGQDTKGALFLVSVIIAEQEREQLANELEEIERDTRKGLSKWNKTSFARRLAYMRAVLSRQSFAGKIFYAHYANSQAYIELTIYTTAKAILYKSAERAYQATITVDGLSEVEIKRFSKGLRQLSIKVRKVRGARDESAALIRLADAVAGFVRDQIEGQEYTQALFEQGVAAGVIKEV